MSAKMVDEKKQQNEKTIKCKAGNCAFVLFTENVVNIKMFSRELHIDFVGYIYSSYWHTYGS